MPNDRKPELIAQTEIIDPEGNQSCEFSGIVSVAVYQNADDQRRGEVQLTVGSFDGEGRDLIVRLSLPELSAALALATLNCVRDL